VGSGMPNGRGALLSLGRPSKTGKTPDVKA
jgi:hypothetical protein